MFVNGRHRVPVCCVAVFGIECLPRGNLRSMPTGLWPSFEVISSVVEHVTTPRGSLCTKEPEATRSPIVTDGRVRRWWREFYVHRIIFISQ